MPSFAVGDARPLLPVLVAASWSAAAGAREAMWWAFIGGLATDLLSGGPLGAFAVAALPAVTAVGLGERSVARPTPFFTGVALVTVASLTAELTYVVVLALVGQPLPAFPTLVLAVAGTAGYTALLALIAFPVARRVWRATASGSPF